MRQEYQDILHKRQYQPISYDNPIDAQAAFQAEPFQVVILALMGGMGEQVLDTIQQHSHTTQVILTTQPGDPCTPALLQKVFRCFPQNAQFYDEIILYVHEAFQEFRRLGGTTP